MATIATSLERCMLIRMHERAPIPSRRPVAHRDSLGGRWCGAIFHQDGRVGLGCHDDSCDRQVGGRTTVGARHCWGFYACAGLRHRRSRAAARRQRIQPLPGVAGLAQGLLHRPNRVGSPRRRSTRRRRRSGVFLAAMVLVSDAAANGWANYALDDSVGITTGRVGHAVITVLAAALVIAPPRLSRAT